MLAGVQYYVTSISFLLFAFLLFVFLSQPSQGDCATFVVCHLSFVICHLSFVMFPGTCTSAVLRRRHAVGCGWRKIRHSSIIHARSSKVQSSKFLPTKVPKFQSSKVPKFQSCKFENSRIRGFENLNSFELFQTFVRPFVWSFRSISSQFSVLSFQFSSFRFFV